MEPHTPRCSGAGLRITGRTGSIGLRDQQIAPSFPELAFALFIEAFG